MAACLTRYEAWPIIGAAIVLAGWVKWRRGTVFMAVLHESTKLALSAAGTALFFMGVSFATTGQWFVTGGFYVPDPKLQGQPMAVYEAIRQGLVDLAGPRFVQFATWSIAIIVIASLLRRSWSGLILPVALVAAAALPFYAYLSGHPFRIRYEVPLILAGAVCIGTAVSMLRFAAPLVAIPMLALVMVQAPTFDPELAPMVVEGAARSRQQLRPARRDHVPAAAIRSAARSWRAWDRSRITCRSCHTPDSISLISFTKAAGRCGRWRCIRIRRSIVGWIMIEEVAEGGDRLYQIAKQWPGFLKRLRASVRRRKRGVVSAYG